MKSTSPSPSIKLHGVAGLLRFFLVMIALATLVTVVSYYWLDQPFARWAYLARFEQVAWFWLLDLPKLFIYLAPVAILFSVFKKATGRFGHIHRALLAASNSLIIGVYFIHGLHFIFARYWPETWLHHNPHFLPTRGYGFNWWHHGYIYQAFPSETMMILFAVLSVFWWVYPRMRWLYVLIWALLFLALMLTHYNFFSDIIAGACVGIMTAKLSLYFSFDVDLETLEVIP